MPSQTSRKRSRSGSRVPSKHTPNVGKAGVRNFRSSAPRKLSARVSPALRRAIKAVVSNQKEKKLDVTLPTGSTAKAVIPVVNNGGAAGPDFYNLMPAPAEGTTNHERVGNEIIVSQSKLRVTITAGLTADQNAVPAIVTLMVGRLKNKVGIPSDADWINMFYATGAAAQGADSTLLTTMMFPVNDDAWDIKERRQYKVGAANGGGLGENNDFNVSYTDEIDIGRYMKKTLQFDNASVTCENDGLYMWLWWNTIDQSTLSLLNRPSVSATVSTRFSDA